METFLDIAVWVLRSLSVGNDEVMQGVKRGTLADTPFTWERCKDAVNCWSAKHFISQPFVGPGAGNIPWTFPPVSSERSGEDFIKIR